MPLPMSRCPSLILQYSEQSGTFHVVMKTIGSESIQESNLTVFVIAVKHI